jgi:hypothetical protein
MLTESGYDLCNLCIVKFEILPRAVVGFPGTGQTEFRNQSNKDIKINHVPFLLYKIISTRLRTN